MPSRILSSAFYCAFSSPSQTLIKLFNRALAAALLSITFMSSSFAIETSRFNGTQILIDKAIEIIVDALPASTPPPAMKRFLLLCLLSASIISFQSFASAQVFLPTGIRNDNANSATSFGTANMLIPADLSATPTLANLASVTHDPVVDGNAWATDTTPTSGTTGSNPDYFPPTNGSPSFTFNLGSPQTLTGFAYWGFLRSSGADAGNEAKSFTLTFGRPAGSGFGNGLVQIGSPLSFTAESPTGLNSREFSFPPVSNVTAVGVTVTDNFFGDSAGVGNANFNGNRVGLSEVRFVNRPQVIVTTLDDEDDGSFDLNNEDDISLREAINHAEQGSFITFAGGLGGNTITLTEGQLDVGKSLVIDASNLTNGLTIDADGQSRVMEIQPGVTAALHGLTLTGGFASGFFPNNLGGAIYNNHATLSLSACTLSGNSANFGGGIFSDGRSAGSATLRLSACTISGNSAAQNGGGIVSDGSLSGSATLNLSTCTLTGNFATFGGGIFSDGTENGGSMLSLSACTLSGNSVTSAGGGIFVNNGNGSATLSLSSTILAGNNASSSVDLRRVNTVLTESGNNLFNEFSPIDPMLAPLGDYGGPTQTMHPLAGSPAILTGGAVTRTDQRGFTLTGPPTIGALKLGAISTVTATTDDDGDTLRAALAAATTPGAIIRFDTGSDDSMITLSAANGQLEVPATANGLFIDASNIPGGVTISGSNQSRVFSIPAAATVAMHSLTIRDGKTADGEDGEDGENGENGEDGGGINSSGTLSLISCTVSHNRTGDGGFGDFGGAGGAGGGIFSSGTLSLISCTVSGNQTGDGGGGGDFGGGFSGFGGGIFANSNSTLTLTTCTVSGNQTGDGGNGVLFGGAGGDGGGIFADRNRTLTLTACTISGNQNGQGGLDTSGGGLNGVQGQSGGVGVFFLADLTIGQSIIAGNTGSSDDFGGGNIDTDLGNNLLGGDPQLAPLGDYGGPTQTMHPLAGSPAILTGGAVTRTDQRGFTLTGPPTIGALKLGAISTVTATTDDDGDTLRAALAAATTPGAIIRFDTGSFDTGSNDSMITLSNDQLEVPATANGLFIDASNIPGGVTISGNNLSRVFSIPAAATVAMHSLTIMDGKTEDDGGIDAVGGFGGGINSSGTLSLISCTVSHNQTGDGRDGITGITGKGGGGGGINSNGTLSLISCTVSHNQTGDGNCKGGGGGGINSSGTLSLISCTVSHNQTGDGGDGDSNSGGVGGDGGDGGGINSGGTLSLISCTVSHNQTGDGGFGDGGVGGIGIGGDGGGIFANFSSTLTACTISGNQTGQGGLDTSGGGFNGGLGRNGGVRVSASTDVTLGQSIIAGNTGSSDDFGGNIDTDLGDNLLGGDPQLAPLGDYGGATFTMPPLLDSPVIDAADGSTTTTDQRGFPIVGTPDIGAVEYQGVSDLRLFWNLDTDGDGNTFGLEHALGTNPFESDNANPRNPNGPTFNAQGHASFKFGRNPDVSPGTILILMRSTDLISFEEIFRISGNSSTNGSGISSTVNIEDITVLDTNSSFPRALYQIGTVSP